MPPAAIRAARPHRHLWLALAALALAVQALIPAGYMAAASGPSFAVVLCTAQGAVTVDAASLHQPGDRDRPKPAHDSPCVFAGHGVGAPPPLLASALLSEPAHYALAQLLPPRPAPEPGRGLAAPPLPARGPPSLLT